MNYRWLDLFFTWGWALLAIYHVFWDKNYKQAGLALAIFYLCERKLWRPA